jgi:hypothetical protein
MKSAMFRIAISFISASTSAAAQYHESTEYSKNNLERWQPEPNGRGTWSILWSCLSMIYLCTWSVLRDDVPEPEFGMGLKIFTIVQSLIAPEYLCFTAAEDFDSVENRPRFGYYSPARTGSAI